MLEKKYQYPVILVPGLCAYGENGLGKVLPYFGKASQLIREEGLECYTVTFGSLSGVWDRACELYAQIVGGTVDYGQAHSERYGTERYGATYEGFVKNWDSTNKISLVAYGFGAPVVRLLAHLLEYGSVKEQRTGDDISPLFRGQMGDYIHAIVTLAGNNDGTTFFQAADYYVPWCTKALTLAAWGGKSLIASVKEMVKDTPKSTPYGNVLEVAVNGSGNYKFLNLDKDLLEKYETAGRDNLFFDAGLEGMAQLNKLLKINPNVYYVSYTGEVTKDANDYIPKKKATHGNPFTTKKKEKLLDFSVPTKKAGILAPLSLFIGTFKNYLPDAPLVTPVYQCNDGFMPTNCALAPSTEEYTSFHYLDTCRPGVWYQMPIEERNHLAFLGLFQKKEAYQDLVEDYLDILCNIG